VHAIRNRHFHAGSQLYLVPTALSLAAVCRDQKAFGRDFGRE
jgi:hypothetical protein